MNQTLVQGNEGVGKMQYTLKGITTLQHAITGVTIVVGVCFQRDMSSDDDANKGVSFILNKL